MTYYHATTADRVPSIQKNGLGGIGADARWPGIERGVYLAEAAEHAVFVLLDWFNQTATDDTSPRDFVEAMRVIVIDDSRVPRALLGPDPDIPRDGIWLYRGVIDVRNMPVVPAIALVAEWEPPVTTRAELLRQARSLLEYAERCERWGYITRDYALDAAEALRRAGRPDLADICDDPWGFDIADVLREVNKEIRDA